MSRVAFRDGPFQGDKLSLTQLPDVLVMKKLHGPVRDPKSGQLTFFPRSVMYRLHVPDGPNQQFEYRFAGYRDATNDLRDWIDG